MSDISSWPLKTVHFRVPTQGALDVKEDTMHQVIVLLFETMPTNTLKVSLFRTLRNSAAAMSEDIAHDHSQCGTEKAHHEERPRKFETSKHVSTFTRRQRNQENL